jgi:hypothetical protein
LDAVEWFFQSPQPKVKDPTPWAVLFFKSCSCTANLCYYTVLISLYSVLVSEENIANEVLSSSRVAMWWQFPPWIRAVGKLAKEESQRTSADNSKGYIGTGMENSGNEPEVSFKKLHSTLCIDILTIFLQYMAMI